MSSRITADSEGKATLYGLTPKHEYDVTVVDVTPPPPPLPAGAYSPTSPWRTPVPISATVRSDSAMMVGYLLGQDPEHRLHAADTSGKYSRGKWQAKASDPLVTVKLTQAWGTNALNGKQIHVPANAKPAPGSDGHFALISEDGVTEIDLWQMKPPASGKLEASWGGIGTYTGSGFDVKPYGGATASGANLLAGLPRAEEFLNATQESFETMNHAIFVTSKACKAGSTAHPQNFIPPAVHGDGTSSDQYAPYQGQRFVLPFTRSQIASMNIPLWQKVLASAASRYGVIVGDKGGPGFGWLPEASLPLVANGQPDPWVALGKREGLPTYEGFYVLRPSGIDWSKLQAINPI